MLEERIEGGHRLGGWGGWITKPECDVLALAEDIVGGHVVGGHADDPADGLTRCF
jgi:hypothetical protein